MSGHPDTPGGEEHAGTPRARELEELARSLGVELPPFRSPLVAFDLPLARAPEDPVYLGGDLHAVHPDAAADQAPARDYSLDAATIVFTDLENQSLETAAVEGVWCVRMEGAPLDSAPYLTIHDTDGRLRAWRLLPPPRLMIGLGHFWLPSIPPFPGEAEDEGQGRRTSHP